MSSRFPFWSILSNHFHELITSMKIITSINSTVKVYQFQKKWIIGGLIIEYDDKPSLKYTIYLNFPELLSEKLAH